jgi:predicted RNA-binding Zn-ribbon protein involved in translation (DUF1610 family)
MLLKEYNLVCRNRKCDFAKKKSKDYGIELYCPDCGTDLIWTCPECERPLQNPKKKFCSLCRFPLEIDVEEHQEAQGKEQDGVVV